MGQGQLKEKKVNQVVLNYKNIQQLTRSQVVGKHDTPPSNSNNERLQYLSPVNKIKPTTRITKSRGKSASRR